MRAQRHNSVCKAVQSHKHCALCALRHAFKVETCRSLCFDCTMCTVLTWSRALPMDAFQDALLSISPKQSFEHAVQILHGTPLLRGRELLPAWRWTPNANAELETEGRLSTTHLESFNQQLLGATLVQSLSWLVDGAGNVLQEQQASVEQQRQQQLAESAPGSSPSSQHPQAETQTSSSSSSSSSSREGLPSDNPASQLLHQALDLVHLFVDLLYAGAAAEADAVWAQAQQQGGDLQEAAAAGARSFQHLADAGDLAFTLSLTCKLLADLVPSLTGAAVLDVANTLAKTSHFLDVWTRCCLYEDREEAPALVNPLAARRLHNKATSFVMALSDSGLPEAAAKGLVAVLKHLPQPDTPAVAATSTSAGAAGSSSSGGGGGAPSSPQAEEGGSSSSSSSHTAAGGGLGLVAGSSSSSSGSGPQEAANSSRSSAGGAGDDAKQAPGRSGGQEGVAVQCYELALQGSMLLLSAAMDHMGHHFLKAGLPAHDALRPMSDVPEVVEQMQVLDSLAASDLVRLQLMALALQQYWVRVLQEETETEVQVDKQQQQQQQLQQTAAESEDQQGNLQAVQQASIQQQQQQQQQQGSCTTTAVPAHCKAFLESFSPGVWSTLTGLPPAARGQWLQRCLAQEPEAATDSIRRRLTQLRVVLAACDQSMRALDTLGHLDVAVLLEVCDTQALAHPSDWGHTEWLVLLHAAAFLGPRDLVYVAGLYGSSLLAIAQRYLDAAAADAAAAMGAAGAAFPQRTLEASSASSSSSSGGGRRKKGGSDDRQASGQAQLTSRSVLNCSMLLHVLRAWAGRRLVTHDVPGRPFYHDFPAVALQQYAGLALLQQQEACCRLPNLLGARFEAMFEMLPWDVAPMVDLLSEREGQRAALSAVSTFSKHLRVVTAAIIIKEATRHSPKGSTESNRQEVEHAVETLLAAGAKGELTQQVMGQVLLSCTFGMCWGVTWMAEWALSMLRTAAALLLPAVRQQALAVQCPAANRAVPGICWHLNTWMGSTRIADRDQEIAAALTQHVEEVRVAARQVVAAAAQVGHLTDPNTTAAAADAEAAPTAGGTDDPQQVNSMADELRQMSLDKDTEPAPGGNSSSSSSGKAGACPASSSSSGSGEAGACPASSSSSGEAGAPSATPTPAEVEVATSALVLGGRIASMLVGMPARFAWLKVKMQATVFDQDALQPLDPLKLAAALRYLTAWVLLVRPLLSDLLPPRQAQLLQLLGKKWEAAGGGLGRFVKERIQSCSDAEFGLTADEQGYVLQLAGCVVVPHLPGCWNPLCCNLSGLSEMDVKTFHCPRCRQAQYCSRACQAAHWKAGHKAVCRPVATAPQVPAAAAAAAAAAAGSSGANEEGAGQL